MRVPDRGRWMSNVSDNSPAEDDLAARRHEDLGRDLELLLARLAESRDAIVRLLASRSEDDETLEMDGPRDEEPVTVEGWGDHETVRDEARKGDEGQYLEPRPVGPLRPLRSSIAPLEPPPAWALDPEESQPQVGEGEVVRLRLDGEVVAHQLPSSLRRPGPPALELALIYREIARNGGEVGPEAGPAAMAGHPVPEGPQALAERHATAAATEAPDRVPVLKIPPSGKSPVPVKPAPVKPVPVKKDGNRPRAENGPRAARRRLLAVVLTAVGAVVLLTTIVSVLPSLVNAL
ncbi:MAG TPA: hypothetical protein VMS00_13270 [Acidimicrobiales bacterium]|nr:hypothetical protein [Acidimicrobiales bacterium]